MGKRGSVSTLPWLDERCIVSLWTVAAIVLITEGGQSRLGYVFACTIFLFIDWYWVILC